MNRNADIELFATAVVSRLGFTLNQHNADQMQHGLQKALERTDCKTVASYLRLFKDPAFAKQELGQLALDLTVSETYFFRHPEQFQALAEAALPERVKAVGATRRLNLLSAGCASGEEPYSLAATLMKDPGLQGWQLRIWGVDINPQLLLKARQARYSEWSLRTLPDVERPLYFQRHSTDYLLHQHLKSMVCFEEGNLLDPNSWFWKPNFFDIIFCRNVMIYFSPAFVRTVVARLTSTLAPEGFLFLGPSETLRGISQQFHLRHTHGAFYYQRKREDASKTTAVPVSESIPFDIDFSPSGARLDPGWASAIAQSTQRIAALTDQSGARASAANLQAAFPAPRDIEELRKLLRQERFDDALRAIDALSGKSATDKDVLMIHAVLLANRGELARAMQLCEQLLAQDELRPGVHHLKAICHEKGGDRLAAAEHDQAAIYLDPQFAMPHLHLGLLARRLGDLSTARRELNEALALLAGEEASRILLFSGGFSRESLIRFCQAQLKLCGEPQ